MIDYHIHLEQGPYDLEWLEKFWQRGKARGLTEIGITEHAHHFREFLPVYEHLWRESATDAGESSWVKSQFRHSIADYVELLDEGRKAGIPLKVGLEMDYFPKSEAKIAALLKSYEFDFVLGSVHFLDTWSFDWKAELGWSKRNVDEVYQRYLNTVTKMVQSDLFDILAHIDVIKVFGHRAQKDLSKEWQTVLHQIAQTHLALEVSTAGLRKPVGEMYPHHGILKEAFALGIPITIASDAHTPLDVGYAWEDAVRFARLAGYGHYSSFAKRNRTEHELPVF